LCSKLQFNPSSSKYTHGMRTTFFGTQRLITMWLCCRHSSQTGKTSRMVMRDKFFSTLTRHKPNYERSRCDLRRDSLTSTTIPSGETVRNLTYLSPIALNRRQWYVASRILRVLLKSSHFRVFPLFFVG